LNQSVCARVAFTRIKLDFWKELSLDFGDYCKVYDGTDNTTRSRSIPCIALHPCCNIMGSWAFYSLMMKTRLQRTQWKKMVTSAEFVEKMNTLDPEAVALESVGDFQQAVVQQEIQDRLGYEQSETDPCVFRRIVENRLYLITVYVDDL
jgi:hypothetical protein